MAAVIDATLGGASANSYVTLADADAYFETTPDATNWDDKTNDQKNRALISATRWIDALSFYGKRCSETQALKWPREDYKVDGIELACTLIPIGIEVATYELARAFANDTDAITGSTGTTGIYDQVELGELKVKYKASSMTPGVINNVFDVYPWLQTYLGPYCMGGATNYAVRLFRG
ncbi:MAG: DnaT-like ssDNA-binding protein [Burkholderiaceae bacterium]